MEAGSRQTNGARGARLTNVNAVRGYRAGEPVRSRTASMPATSRSSA